MYILDKKSQLDKMEIIVKIGIYTNIPQIFPKTGMVSDWVLGFDSRLWLGYLD